MMDEKKIYVEIRDRLEWDGHPYYRVFVTEAEYQALQDHPAANRFDVIPLGVSKFESAMHFLDMQIEHS